MVGLPGSLWWRMGYWRSHAGQAIQPTNLQLKEEKSTNQSAFSLMKAIWLIWLISFLPRAESNHSFKNVLMNDGWSEGRLLSSFLHQSIKLNQKVGWFVWFDGKKRKRKQPQQQSLHSIHNSFQSKQKSLFCWRIAGIELKMDCWIWLNNIITVS